MFIIDDIIGEYDDLLIGRRKAFSRDLFYGAEPGGYNEKMALECIRYAIESLLRWDADTAVQKFDSYIIKSLKLDTVLRYIDFPPDLDFGNAKYILSRLYPDRVKLNMQTLTITTLTDILAGKRAQFPRDYFIGPEGFVRYCYCIKHLIEIYVPFNSIPDIYEYFLQPSGNAFLAASKLKIPTYQYKLNVFDAIHRITQKEPDSDLYYYYYSFLKEYNKIVKEEKTS